MKLERNLENVLNEINCFINIDDDREKYTKHCDYIKNLIFNLLRQDSVFSYFFNGFQLEGKKKMIV